MKLADKLLLVSPPKSGFCPPFLSVNKFFLNNL